MTNYTSSTPDLAIERDSLSIEIDGNRIQVDSNLLGEPTRLRECQQLIHDAHNVAFHDWQRALNIPLDYQPQLIQIVACESSSRPVFYVSGEEVGNDAFSSTLAINLGNGNDINRCGRVQALAVALARALYPENAEEPAQLIRDWRRRNGLATQSRRQIVSEIIGPGANGRSPKLTPQVAARVVLDFLQQESLGDDEAPVAPPVRYFHSKFYRWVNLAWSEVIDPRPIITRALQATCNDQPLTTTFITSVIENLRAMIELAADRMATPLLVESESPLRVEQRNIIAFRNGHLELPEETAEPSLSPVDARVFLPLEVDYDFDPTAQCPLWLSTLAEIFPPIDERDQRPAILQELFGYCLLRGNNRIEKMFILTGAGANGKSVCLDVLRAMLGVDNVSCVPLENFVNRFLIADLDRKSANISYDMHRIPKVQEGVLKQLVSGEPTQCDVKHAKSFIMQPTAKLVFATNHLPSFADTSDGVFRRLCVIPFFERFNGEDRDVTRSRNLMSELPGIFNWAIAGAQRLLRAQQLSPCSVCDEAVTQHRADSDPVAQFVDECCDVGAELSEPATRLYAIYRSFCQFSGRCPKANNEFGKDLLRLDGIRKARPSEAGQRIWTYQGIALRSECIRFDRNTDELKFNPRTQSRRNPFVGPLPPLGNIDAGGDPASS